MDWKSMNTQLGRWRSTAALENNIIHNFLITSLLATVQKFININYKWQIHCYLYHYSLVKMYIMHYADITSYKFKQRIKYY